MVLAGERLEDQPLTLITPGIANYLEEEATFLEL